ncbi:hypothetical protein M5E89_12225 [Acidaminococcus intestini]|nr:hypothetical protein M5E89_12225 [Acidaminococcus intestini]
MPHLDAVYRLYRYEGGVKRALHGLKYEKRRDYLDRMGRKSCTTRRILSLYLQEILLS